MTFESAVKDIVNYEFPIDKKTATGLIKNVDHKIINVLESIASFFGYGELFRSDGQLNSSKVTALINTAIGDSRTKAVNYLNELRSLLASYDGTLISPSLKSVITQGKSKLSDRIKQVEQTVNAADKKEQDANNTASQVDLQSTNSAKWDIDGSVGNKLKTDAVSKAKSAAELYESALTL